MKRIFRKLFRRHRKEPIGLLSTNTHPVGGEQSLPLTISDVIKMATYEPAQGWHDLGFTKRRSWTTIEALDHMGNEFDAMFAPRQFAIPYDISRLFTGPARIIYR